MDKSENDNRVMVDLTRVTMTYPPDVEALRDVSLQVNSGEVLFLTGMSGAGKTTLLRLISGIEKPTKGYIEVNGLDLNKISRSKIQGLRRLTGVAYQNFKLLPDRTVAQNIAISMEVAYRSGVFIRKQTRDLLAQLRLEDKYNTRASKLSRGEQQRVAIARAVANRPRLILADEPTGNLDGETTKLVMDLFYRCNDDGTTILIATHDGAIYNHPGSRVVHLQDGKITDIDSTSDQPAGDPDQNMLDEDES